MCDEGLRTVYGKVGEHAGVKGARFRVADVSRPVMATSDMLERGQRIVFDRDENGKNASCAEHKASGRRVPIKEINRMYEMETDLAPCPPHSLVWRGCGP